MGFKDFFRKKPIKEEVSLKEAVEILFRKLKEGLSDLDKSVKEIVLLVRDFERELDSQLNVLKRINLDEKREHERLKMLTLQGLFEYIRVLERLKEGLGKVEEGKDYVFCIDLIKSLFEEFNRDSRKKFERATILIGKELADTERVIKEFYNNVGKINSKNIGLVREVRKIKNFEKLCKDIDSLRKSIKGVSKEKEGLEKDLESFVKEESLKKDELDSFLKSSEYTSWLKGKDSFEEEIKKFRGDIFSIKSEMDIKELLKINHKVPRKFELVKKYRDDFLNALREDSILEIVDALPESKKGAGFKIKDLRERDVELKKRASNFNENKEKRGFEKRVEEISRKVLEVREKIRDLRSRLNKLNEELLELRDRKHNLLRDILEENDNYVIKRDIN